MNSTNFVIDCPIISRQVINDFSEIEKVDSEESSGLEMFSYKEGTTETSSEIARQTRGIVYKEDKIIMKTFGYTPEFSEHQSEQINSYLAETDLSTCKIFESREGALIRVFFDTNKWYITTHRKLDAFRSKWSSKESFGSIFERSLVYRYSTNPEFQNFIGLQGATNPETILELFLNKLDKSLVHTFLISNTEENRIVCNSPLQPVSNYVGSFSPDGNTYTFINNFVETPREMTFSSVTEMCEYVNGVNPRLVQGVIVITPTLKYFKVINNQYRLMYELRGNCSSIKFRYLQLRTNGAKITSFLSLYPLYQNDFIEYENILSQISKRIHQAYIARFIHKQYARVTPDEYRVIRECHGQHITNRSYIVTAERIKESLNKQSPVTLNRMIKEFKNPKSVSTISHQTGQEIVIDECQILEQSYTPMDM